MRRLISTIQASSLLPNVFIRSLLVEMLRSLERTLPIGEDLERREAKARCVFWAFFDLDMELDDMTDGPIIKHQRVETINNTMNNTSKT